jgi:outer membrane receptor protein involved in Fe transport
MDFNVSVQFKTGLISLLILPSLQSFANDSIISKKPSSYPASFFMQYQPQNAYDMINRLPGFSFDGGSNERGFGGNAGNVLIDGSRPTSKSGGLQASLTRIPVAQVARIEIIRGGKGSSDTSGQSIVANIVRKKDITTGTWALKVRRAPDGDFRPNIEATMTTRMGQWETTFDTDIGGWVGYRTALIENKDSHDKLTKSANELLDEKNIWSNVSGQGSKKFNTGQLTLNGRLRGNKWQAEVTRDTFASLSSPQKTDEFWQLEESNVNKDVELGVDWLGNADDWKWHLLGLAVVKSKNYENTIQQENYRDPSANNSRFKQDRFKTEYIIRNTYRKIGDEKFKPEYGFEIANNKLDTELDFFQNNQQQILGAANVTVEEYRGEAFVSFMYSATDNLSIEGGLTAEFSTIKVTGDATNKQDFTFLKPRLSANYNFSSDLQFSVLAEHNVGQLDFNDFAASNEAADDRNTAGNPNLLPEQSTELSTTLDWGFSEKGSLSVNFYYEWRKDILEYIILPSDNNSVSHALGNAGNATFWGVETELSLPLDSVIQNGLLVISYEYAGSKYFDSIINDHRVVNNFKPENLNIEFRQDLIADKMAWGVEFFSHFTESNYLVDELITFDGNNRVEAFIETTYIDGLKIQLQVSHLNTGEYTRSRLFYENNRLGAYKGSQISQRKREPEMKLSVWGTF